jgi:hypothetical protein
MKLYMFRTVRLSIIRSLFTVHWAMVYVIQVCSQLSSRTRMELHFHPGPARKLFVWHIPLMSVQWINSWWWTDELSETCGVSWQNKFMKLVHLVGFVTKKFVTIQHGHVDGKLSAQSSHLYFITWHRMLSSYNKTPLNNLTYFLIKMVLYIIK